MKRFSSNGCPIDKSIGGSFREKENPVVRLTIFDNRAVNATADFVKMARPIESTEI